MIIDHISTAIVKKSTKLILGRTANEFKSNFELFLKKTLSILSLLMFF